MALAGCCSVRKTVSGCEYDEESEIEREQKQLNSKNREKKNDQTCFMCQKWFRTMRMAMPEFDKVQSHSLLIT